MKALFLKKQVWGAITGYGDEEGEDEGPPEAEQRRRKRNDEIAMGLIVEHISDSFMDDIDSCETSREAWDNLKAVCTTYTMHDQIQFLGELLDFRKPDSMTMEEYISRMNQMNKRLSLPCGWRVDRLFGCRCSSVIFTGST